MFLIRRDWNDSLGPVCVTQTQKKNPSFFKSIPSAEGKIRYLQFDRTRIHLDGLIFYLR